MSSDILDLIIADLVDLNEIQLLDLASKILNLAYSKLEDKEYNNEN